MARPKTLTLEARYRLPDGKTVYRPVPVEVGLPIFPKVAPGMTVVSYNVRLLENGKSVRRRLDVTPDGAPARIPDATGQPTINTDVVFENWQREFANFQRVRFGMKPHPIVEQFGALPAGNGQHKNGSRIRVKDAAAKYIQELTASVANGEKSVGTLTNYRNAVEDFARQCGVEFIDEITRDVLLQHKNWLFAHTAKRVRGKKSTSVANRFRYLSTFLRQNGIQLAKARHAAPGDPGLLNWNECPREEKAETPSQYSDEEINALLEDATVDEADLIQFLLRTGFRDGEAMHAEWSDIDWTAKTITVRDKPKYGWRVKDRESRTVPVEDGVLLKRLAVRRKRQKPASNLIFPQTQNGGPDPHLIRFVQHAAARAEAKGFKFSGAISLHRFRRSYASRMIGVTNLQTVQQLLGHSDVETTARYLAPDTEKARQGSKTAFNGLGD